MKSNLTKLCILLALWIHWCPQARSQPVPQVPPIVQLEVRHVGPPAASDELILSNIRVKQGDSFSQTSVDADIRSLYSTGFFSNIQVLQELSSEGMKLVYVVRGKLLLTDISFSGNEEIKDRKLKKAISSKVGEPLDERKLFSDAQEIQKLYEKAGHQGTRVQYVLSPNEVDGRGAVDFQVTEAPRIKIRDVVFEGAEAFEQKKLRKVIKTRKRWMFSWLTGSGILKQEQFEDDQDKLREFYQGEGYIDFRIQDVDIQMLDEKWMKVVISVHEGRPYNVGDVSVTGAETFPAEEIRSGLKMVDGARFTPDGLADDLEKVEDYYGAKGYIDTFVQPIEKPNVETGTIDVEYKVEEGSKAYIEKIEIRGNTKTKDRVIRRELAVAPGEVFDMVRVKLSKRRLQGLDYFSSVDTRNEETDVPDRRNLIISVEEKSTGNLTFGAGVSSVDSVVGFIELTQGNFDIFKPPTFTGGGQKFRLRTQVGTQRQDYQMSFIEPWFTGRKLALGVDLYHRNLQFVSDLYDERRTGAKVSLTRALGSEFLIGSVSYTLENVGIKNVATTAPALIAQEAGDRLVSKVGFSLAYDTRNSGFDPDNRGFLPDEGQRTEILADYAGGPLGGDTDIYRLEMRSSWYFKGFGNKHVFEVHGKGGVVDSHGGNRVPLFDRWFLGGLYSLRGYQYRQVGPRVGGEPLGGSTYWFGSAEYSIPVMERLRLAAFYDIGMVYQDAYSFDTKNFQTGMYNDNVGIGMRIQLPIGPLRLDYGYPLSSDPFNGGTGRFQFGVGWTRQF